MSDNIKAMQEYVIKMGVPELEVMAYTEARLVMVYEYYKRQG